MLQHLFKLTWNKKKQNFLLVLEVFVSFLVLFAVFSLLIYQYRNYRTPMGFVFQNTWAINIFPEDRQRGWDISDSAASYHDNVVQTLNSFPEVQSSSFSFFNTPFVMGQSSTALFYNNQQFIVSSYITDNNYARTLDLEILEGKWYDRPNQGNGMTQIVINRTLKEKLFHNQNAIGKVFLTGENKQNKLIVTGVVNDFKDKGDFAGPEDAVYMQMAEDDLKKAGTILVTMKAGSDANVESKLQKALFHAAKNSNVEINHLARQLKTKNRVVLIPTIILLIMSGFLVVNVGLGLFGILWYNISRRRSEIGLRMAVGATTKNISRQLIAESLSMSTIAVVTGLFFAFQFPMLKIFDVPPGIYLLAILFSVGFIYLLVGVCSFYPGRQAARIRPAIALHED